MSSLLEVEGLSVHLSAGDSLHHVVRDVSFSVAAGATLGIVGESGCGKTMSTMGLIGLLPDYALVDARSVRWDGDEVGLAGLRRLRGTRISSVFQDPMTALNPLLRVGAQVAESLRGQRRNRTARRQAVLALLDEVGIRDVERCSRLYPWELSGGMAQRVLIAMALASEPDLLIADEPTTAIDASMRKRVLDLLSDIQRSRGLAVLLISHDLAVVRAQATEVAVMYAGRIVERGPVGEVGRSPQHPYTRALIACTLDPFEVSDLAPIPGEPPRPAEIGADCAFRSRCPESTARCTSAPIMRPVPSPGRRSLVACWNATEASRTVTEAGAR